MITTFPTYETGGKTLEQGMLTVTPDARMQEEELKSFGADTGLDGVFLAGALSMFLTHERNGIPAYRALGGATANPMLKQAYKQFEDESVAAVEAYERAIEELGGNPQYVSPAARLAEAADGKLLESLLLSGGADPMTIDAATVSIAGLAAMKCVMNVETLRSFASEADQGPSRAVLDRLVTEVGPPSEKHHAWALKTHVELATTAAKHTTTSKIMNKAEEVVSKLDKKRSQS